MRMEETRVLTSVVQNPASHKSNWQSYDRQCDLVRNALVVLRERALWSAAHIRPGTCSAGDVTHDLLVEARDGDLGCGRRGRFWL